LARAERLDEDVSVGLETEVEHCVLILSRSKDDLGGGSVKTGQAKSMARRPVLWGLLSVLVLLGGVALLRRGAKPTEVEVESAARRAVFQSFVNASGEIVATRYADIGSSVMGRLVELTVEEGERVKSGEVIARIDAVQARSDLAAAEALVKTLESETRAARERERAARSNLELAKVRVQEAKLKLDRARELSDRDLLARAEYDAVEAGADAASAQLAAATADAASAAEALNAAERRVAQSKAQTARARDVVAKTEITAPMDGVVTRLQVRQGEMVVVGVQNQPGTILMTISDLSAINADVKVAEADVLRVAIGQPAKVVLEALPGEEFTGRVVTVGASALPVVGPAAAREFKVTIRLDAPDEGLRPGLTCDAEILTSEKRDVLTVPLQAVVLRPDPESGVERAGVFALVDDTVRFLPVEAGAIGGLEIEVAGIEEGVPVVTGPFQALRELADGEKVARAESPASR
jgi:HlyD family secretion protein